MKLYCFLLTFVLVNGTERDEASYKEAVFFTNAAIKLAYNKNDLTVKDRSGANGLEHVIEKIVNDEDYNCFAKINIMIAVPDQTDIVSIIPGLEYFHPAKKRRQYQIFMQTEIANTLKIDIPKAEEHQDFGRLDLTDLADERRILVKKALKNIFKRIIGTIYYQLLMKLERRVTLGFNLTSLVEARRVTGTSPRNIIEWRVFDGPVRDVSLFQMCRLMGLYMSTQFPTSYIKEIWIDPIINTCTLDDGITQKIFKKINGEWWQISPDDDTVRLLEEHLR